MTGERAKLFHEVAAEFERQEKAGEDINLPAGYRDPGDVGREQALFDVANILRRVQSLDRAYADGDDICGC